MKLISLNTYGGHCFDELMRFVVTQAETTDVFCFQEVQNSSKGAFISNGVRTNLFQELSQVLSDFQGFFTVSQQNYDQTAVRVEGTDTGVATFVRNSLRVKNCGDFFIYGSFNSFVYGDYNTFPHNLQYVQLEAGEELLTICNVHGTSRPQSKLDSPERLEQSQKILAFVDQQPGQKVIVGDFNLLPDTKSIRLFEEKGFRNLIKEYRITTTRGTMMRKLFPQYEHGPYGWQEFADYAFVSAGITPTRFTVPDVPISDHLPMILECVIGV